MHCKQEGFISDKESTESKALNSRARKKQIIREKNSMPSLPLSFPVAFSHHLSTPPGSDHSGGLDTYLFCDFQLGLCSSGQESQLNLDNADREFMAKKSFKSLRNLSRPHVVQQDLRGACAFGTGCTHFKLHFQYPSPGWN